MITKLIVKCNQTDQDNTLTVEHTYEVKNIHIDKFTSYLIVNDDNFEQWYRRDLFDIVEEQGRL